MVNEDMKKEILTNKWVVGKTECSSILKKISDMHQQISDYKHPESLIIGEKIGCS